MKRRRATVAFALFGLAAGLGQPATLSAHSWLTGNHYVEDCDKTVFDSEYQTIGHTFYVPVNVTSIYGARGTATVEDLKACHSPGSDGVVGISAIFPANIEGFLSGTSGPGGHIQLGYGITNCPSGAISCTSGMPDNALRFLWTDHDDGPGYIEPAYGAPVPQQGVKYRFTINASSNGFGSIWEFEIRNQDTSTVVWSTWIFRTWQAGGYRAWSGAEIINAASRINRKDTDSLNYVSNIKYSPPLGGCSSYPSNGCHWATVVDQNSRGNPTSSWAECTQGVDVDGDVRINPWTKSHNSF